MYNLEPIINYIKFLEKEYLLNISIHCFYPPLNALMPIFRKHNTHYHPFCMYIKSNSQLWDICRLKQKKVLKKCDKEIFFGRCYFGVSEYVLPIKKNNKPIGFISVSGFVKNHTELFDRLKYISDEYNISYDKLIDVAESLSSNIPDEKFVKSILLHISQMLALIAQDYTAEYEGNNNTNYIYSNALAYIHEHYKEPITVDDIVKFCKCSRSYITHLFNENGKIKFKSYVTELRMKEAKKMLINTDMSVNEIAFSLGYNDSNYFSNVFYKNIGVYPRKFRNENK